MKVLSLVAAATLIAGCEVNLNTEGLSAREVKNFTVTGQPELVLDTFDGAIRAEAIEGKIILRTSDGSVVASRLGGDVQIRSGDGSIRIDNSTGSLDLETDDGSIGVDAKPSVLRLKTGDGSVRVTVAPETVMTDNWDITTSDGSIVVTLPNLFSADLDVETSDGVVRTNHPLLEGDRDGRRDGEGSDERRERRRTLRSKMGDGGKLLKVRSGDGTIRIDS